MDGDIIWMGVGILCPSRKDWGTALRQMAWKAILAKKAYVGNVAWDHMRLGGLHGTIAIKQEEVERHVNDFKWTRKMIGMV